MTTCSDGAVNEAATYHRGLTCQWVGPGQNARQIIVMRATCGDCNGHRAL